jgi:DNA repair protein RecN (Recombination protein N)
MLCRLIISNIAVIDKAEVAFDEGLNILTGETGAGKSLVIDAINILLGQRGNRELIRYGENKARVEAAFFLPDYLRSIFSDYIEDSDDMVIISRELYQDGRNICAVNGRLVPVSALKELGKNLISIHGQQDSQTLLHQSTHIDYIDKYYKEKISVRLTDYRELYNKMKALKDEIEKLTSSDSGKLERLENLEYWANEIDSAHLVSGEDEELHAKRQVFRNYEKIYSALSKAYEVIYGSEDFTVFSALGGLSKELAPLEQYDGIIKNVSELVCDSMYKAEEAARLTSDYLQGMNFDAGELSEIEARLDTIQKLKLKYGNTIEDILEHLNEIEAEIGTIKTSGERIEACRKQLDEVMLKLHEQGEYISGLRREAARIIEEKVVKELGELNMSSVKFKIDITKCIYSYNGTDRVEFLISTNPAEPLKPLVKIASGGEMSRICLALKTVLSHADNVHTLIFDEIDSGVSGRAAQKIGEKMKYLAKDKQLICITHLPQIAASADSHFLINKDENQKNFSTDIIKLDRDGRINEIARMISGDIMGEQALKAAEEMLGGHHKNISKGV